eukprot:6206501-Pleurochrysis_carterae.AAC.1
MCGSVPCAEFSAARALSLRSGCSCKAQGDRAVRVSTSALAPAHRRGSFATGTGDCKRGVESERRVKLHRLTLACEAPNQNTIAAGALSTAADARPPPRLNQDATLHVRFDHGLTASYNIETCSALRH